MDLDGHHRPLGCVGCRPFGEELGVVGEERCRRPDRVVAGPISRARVAEPPPLRPASDRDLFVAFGCQPRSGEDPTVIRATGPGTVFVDRASIIDKHRAVTPLVVADQDVAFRPSGSREEQLGGNTGEGVGLVGSDVDELGRRAAGSAASARHIGAAFVADGAKHLVCPC